MKSKHISFAAGVTILAVIAAATFKDGVIIQPVIAQDSVLTTDQLIAIQGTTPMDPDEFSWKIFASISQPVSPDYQQTITPAGGSPVTTNDVAWEQWADNNMTFELSIGERYIDKPPTFPDYSPAARREHGGPPSGMRLQPDPVIQLMNARITAPVLSRAELHAQDAQGLWQESPEAIWKDGKITTSGSDMVTPLIDLYPGIGFTAPAVFGAQGALEEVRRNRVSFKYLVDNNFWTKPGLVDYLAQNSSHVNLMESMLTMPAGSVEVKAYWEPCPPNDPDCSANFSTAHLNYDRHGKRYALTALHLMSKVMTKDGLRWIFSTWEWAGDNNQPDKPGGNKGRCDILGCIDQFGSGVVSTTGKGITEAVDKAGLTTSYTPGPITPELDAVMTAYGLNPIWRNYRLKKTQTDFEEPTPPGVQPPGVQPSRSGNSQFEGGYVASSSCISCHGRSGIGINGISSKDIDDLPLFTGTLDKPIGPVGSLQEGWFITASHMNRVYRTDSIWSLLNAQPAKAHSPSP